MTLLDIMLEWSSGKEKFIINSNDINCKQCRAMIGVIHKDYVYMYGLKNGRIMPYEPNFFEQIIERSEHPCEIFLYMSTDPTFFVAS